MTGRISVIGPRAMGSALARRGVDAGLGDKALTALVEELGS